ncbi:MAG TPA: transglutaminase-like cysteine peptidase [Devosia sp.]|jgi:predicted transglutaminase-like cysteine proteinase|nr:transglutaminase-like cysteine peptidase [Devosia sp.]
MKTLMLVAAVAVMIPLTTMPSQARAPLGFQLMCLQNPSACKASGSAQIKAGPGLRETLSRVNLQVNRTMHPVNDRGPDVWSLNARSGDCEDFVLAKRGKLIAQGLPSSALRIAYVKTRQGVDHAVLVVKTNNGDLTLDNLTNELKPLSRTGYRVISMSGANPLHWS